jgi:hypothetical protein
MDDVYGQHTHIHLLTIHMQFTTSPQLLQLIYNSSFNYQLVR